MKYEVIWSERAARELAKLDRVVGRRIADKVARLETSPLTQVRRLVGSPYYRLRVGDYRVIVEVVQSQVRVLVLKVGHRSSVY